MGDWDYMLTGHGLLHLDVTLGALAALAAAIQYWRIAAWRSTGLVYVGRWAMAIGWTIMAGRITQTLWMVGDILISLPSLIALILISSGSVMVSLFWRNHHGGPG